MSEWERIIRRELRQYARNHGDTELNQVEIYQHIKPAIEDAFPDTTAYNNHIQSTLERLAANDEIEILNDGRYRLTFDRATDDTPQESAQTSTSDTTTTHSPSASTDESSENASNVKGPATPTSDTPPKDSEMTTASETGGNESTLETKSLYGLLRSCQMGEAGAIVGGHIDRNDLRQQLYVETEEDHRLTDFFVENYERDGKHLVITGSAGDGKSALLSRAFKQARQQGVPLEEGHIHMDATAARAKHQTYDDTLDDFLESVDTYLDANDGPRTGLAINLGLAIDFFERHNYRVDYPEIWDAIDSTRNTVRYETDDIVVINLSHRDTYDTAPDNLGGGLLEALVDKFAFDNPNSPFHDAFKASEQRCDVPDECPLHYNVRQFTDESVRRRVTELIAASGLIHNSYLNPRAILDIISKMIVPDGLQVVSDDTEGCPIGRTTKHGRKFDADVLFWNAVFERLAGHGDTTQGFLDPTAQAHKATDETILGWSAGATELQTLLGDVPVVDDHDVTVRARTALRKQYLAGESEITTAKDWSWFAEFTGALTFFDSQSGDADDYKRKASSAVNTVTEALKGWSGTGATSADWIEFVDGVQGEYKFLSKWEKPTPNKRMSRRETREETIPGQLWIVLQPGNTDLDIPVPVTFELYLLMKRISRGYRPNARDLERSEGIRLIHSRLSEFTDKKDTVRITDKSDQNVLRLTRDAFETVEIETGGDA